MSRPIQLALHKSFIAHNPTSGEASPGTIGEINIGMDCTHPADAIDRKHGWYDEEFKSDADLERAEFVRETVIKECVKGYGEIFYFCFSGASGVVVPINSASNLQTAFTRFVAVTRVLFPELLTDKDGALSQARVAQLLGKSPTYIADLGTRFSDNWKFYSRVQKTKSEKDASRIARLDFLARKRNAPKVARKPNGKLAQPSSSSSSLNTHKKQQHVG